ncbi:DUF2779 domain-containing protein [Paraburkholderia fungorum]|uniref:DUF2779 domain-containing protein n=1 Tax=Paraburkholderia fungorum TaxID=134537 RepID=UPI0038BA9A4F
MTRTYRLSKSKIMSGLQCHKRLWLEMHKRELAQVSPESEHIFRMGHLFGDRARELMGPGELVGHERDIVRALDETPAALACASANGTVVYEAAFSYRDVVSRADGFAPYLDGWHMIEVKAATSDKAYFYLDCALQAWVAEGAGYPVRRVTLAYTNNQFVYAGGENYAGLLRELDVTSKVAQLKASVDGIVGQLQTMLARDEPDIRTGGHCSSPYECPFISYCRSQEPPPAEFPVEIFHRITARKLRQAGYTNALEVPETALGSARNLLILRASREGAPYIAPSAQQFLRTRPYPRYFLDFETMSSSVPFWAGTRPYQQIPFQWSCHVETAPGILTHHEFLDLSGELPAREFVRSLIETVGTEGPVIVYSTFERTRLRELCELVPECRDELQAIMRRLLDLLQVVRSGYYHPAMKGSFSIKQVVPTLCPELEYTSLNDVADGGAAQRAWWAAVDASTSALERLELRGRLLEYCKRDTLAMVAVYGGLCAGRAVRLSEYGIDAPAAADDQCGHAQPVARDHNDVPAAR